VQLLVSFTVKPNTLCVVTVLAQRLCASLRLALNVCVLVPVVSTESWKDVAVWQVQVHVFLQEVPRLSTASKARGIMSFISCNECVTVIIQRFMEYQ